MRQDVIGFGGWQVDLCQYAGSRLVFRGPPRDLTGPFIACLGGTETFGSFVDLPYPARLEQMAQCACVNLGSVNAGIAAFAADARVLAICTAAHFSFVQIMGAQTVVNRYFTLHPRRNDRVLRVTPLLQGLYPTLDFADVVFVRHLLARLRAADARKFQVIVRDLQRDWLAQMGALLDRIGPRCALVGFARMLPGTGQTPLSCDLARADPLFVSRPMIDRLRPRVQAVVFTNQRPRRGYDERLDQIQRVAAAHLPGDADHAAAAAALHRLLLGDAP